MATDDLIFPAGYTIECTGKGTILMLVKLGSDDRSPYAVVYANHPDPIRELIRRFDQSSDPRLKR